MSYDSDIRTINSSLQDVGRELKDHRDQRAEISARLQDIEQRQAMADSNGTATRYATRSIGLDAINALADDTSFQAAAEQVSRGMKPGQFSSRTNLDGSIRAALTNDGHGGTGDTSYSSQPEQRGPVGPVQPPLRLLAALPHRPTTRDSVEYVQVTNTGDADVQANEGDAKAELAFSGTAVKAAIATIAGWAPASKQVLSDQAGLAQLIDSVLRNRVLAKLESQLINGTGADGQIGGLVSQATAFTPTTTTAADAVGESLVDQANAGYLPGLILLNPADWYALQTARVGTSDARYIFGSPTVPVPPALWNARVVTPPSMPAGKAMTIDASHVTVLDREQASVTISNSHADFFTRNLVAILAELRAGLEIRDAGAVNLLTLPATT